MKISWKSETIASVMRIASIRSFTDFECAWEFMIVSSAAEAHLITRFEWNEVLFLTRVQSPRLPSRIQNIF